MSRQRTTFGKLQREREKQEKAMVKRERRRAAAEQAEAQPPRQPAEESTPALIDLIADLHGRFEAGQVSFEAYEEQKAELLRRLAIE